MTPPPVVLSDSVRMQVASNEEAVTWRCVLLPASDPAPAAAALKACDIQLDGSIEFDALVDGQRYTFYVQAVDALGNASPVRAPVPRDSTSLRSHALLSQKF